MPLLSLTFLLILVGFKKEVVFQTFDSFPAYLATCFECGLQKGHYLTRFRPQPLHQQSVYPPLFLVFPPAFLASSTLIEENPENLSLVFAPS